MRPLQPALSHLHEGLTELFRLQPKLAVQLLRGPLRVRVPRHSAVELGDTTFAQLAPTQYRADAVVILRNARRKAVFAIVVEVQLNRDTDKRWSWPNYVTSLRQHHRCGAALLVITADERIARWSAQAIDIGHPGMWVKPIVLRPAKVPRIKTEKDAAKHLELAVLSAIAHSKSTKDAPVLKAALGALRTSKLEESKTRYYADLIYAAMSGAARHALEKDMRDLTVEEYQSDFARKYGLQGKSEGLLEGKSEGLLEGKSEGIADGIFAVLSVRKLSLTPDQIARINNNRDPEQLRMWLARATTVATAAEIFDPPDEAQTH